MAVVTALGIVFAPGLVHVIAYGFGDVAGKWPLTVFMTRVMFPYLVFITLAALASGILNSLGRFFVPASTPVLFNLAVIAAVVGCAGGAREPVVVFAVGVVAGGVLQLALQLPFLRSEGIRFSFRPGLPRPRRPARRAAPAPGDLRRRPLPGQLRAQPDDGLRAPGGERLGPLLRLAHRGADAGALLHRPRRRPAPFASRNRSRPGTSTS